MKKEMKEIDMHTLGAIIIKPRRDRGLPQLTKRDRVALSWIGEQYTVRFDTLARLLGRMPGKSQNAPREPGKISPSSVNRAIKRWELLGLVETQKMWREEPKWVWLTSVGLRMQGLSYAPYSPRQGTDLAHKHTVNEVRLRLEEKYADELRWTSERTLKKWHGELTPAERKKIHSPDGLVTLSDTQVAVEVEISDKSNKRIKQIFSKLLTQYPGVWYFVNDISEPVVKRNIGRSTKIKVYPLSDVLD
jgi:hypothetical protein